MSAAHQLHVCGGTSRKEILSVTRAMVVDYDEGCIAVDANGVFGTARLPTVERLTFEELLPINAVVRAWSKRAKFLPRGDERAAICVGYVGGWQKNDGDSGQAMPHSLVDSSVSDQLAYADAQIALGTLFSDRVLPRVRKYIACLLDVPEHAMREVGLGKGPFMSCWFSIACGDRFWSRMHVDDDVWVTLLLAMGGCEDGGGWANPSCGVIQKVHAGDIYVVNPQVVHGTCEFGDVNADRCMLAVYVSRGCMRGALTSAVVAEREGLDVGARVGKVRKRGKRPGEKKRAHGVRDGGV
jgi:hypothetical protein